MIDNTSFRIFCYNAVTSEIVYDKNEINEVDKFREGLDKKIRQVDMLHISTVLKVRRDHFAELLLYSPTITSRLKGEKTATVFAAW